MSWSPERPISRLSLRLVQQARAELVCDLSVAALDILISFHIKIYESIRTADPGMLRKFLEPTSRHLSENFEDDLHGPNLFCKFAEVAINVPRILQRGEGLPEQSEHPSSCAEAKSVLEDAKREDHTLTSWPEAPTNNPSKTYCFERLRTDHSEPMYPSKILYYDNATQASVSNSWRFCRIRILCVVSQACSLLEGHCGENPESERAEAEAAITDIVDDICSSIPYYLGWRTPPNLSDMHFPHSSGDVRSPQITDVETIANWSQMMTLLSTTSSLSCVPQSQRDWMRGYLTLFSNDLGPER